MLDRLDCSAEPSSVRAARRFVIDKLQEWECDDLVDSAALVTSELATNAVLHTGQPYSVAIEQRDGGVRVEVADSVPAMPPRPAAVPAVGLDPAEELADGEPVDMSHLFSGLGLVDAVATRWGSQAAPGGGKVVWFELARRPFGRSRDELVDLRDLRDPEPAMWVPPSAEDSDWLAEGRRGGPMRWLLGSRRRH